MKEIYFNNLEKYIDNTVTLEGFVDNIRDLQYVQFIILRDSTGKIQVTVEKNEQNAKLNEIVSNLSIESTVKITGKLVQNEKVKLNGKELIPTEIIVTSKCLEELPINYKDSSSASLDTRLNYRFLNLRNEKNLLMFKVQTCLVDAMRKFVFITDFSSKKRAFYHKRNDEGVPLGADLIWKGCEITTLALREHIYSKKYIFFYKNRAGRAALN